MLPIVNHYFRASLYVHLIAIIVHIQTTNISRHSNMFTQERCVLCSLKSIRKSQTRLLTCLLFWWSQQDKKSVLQQTKKFAESFMLFRSYLTNFQKIYLQYRLCHLISCQYILYVYVGSSQLTYIFCSFKFDDKIQSLGCDLLNQTFFVCLKP